MKRISTKSIKKALHHKADMESMPIMVTLTKETSTLDGDGFTNPDTDTKTIFSTEVEGVPALVKQLKTKLFNKIKWDSWGDYNVVNSEMKETGGLNEEMVEYSIFFDSDEDFDKETYKEISKVLKIKSF